MLNAKKAFKISKDYLEERANDDLFLILIKIEDSAKKGLTKVIVNVSHHELIDNTLQKLGYNVVYSDEKFRYIISWYDQKDIVGSVPDPQVNFWDEIEAEGKNK